MYAAIVQQSLSICKINHMNNQKNTVAQGGLSVTLARMLGMASSFVLFIFLARHSSADAGLFRTVVTYIVMSEFLGILGLHRWLSVEIAAFNAKRWSIFYAVLIFSTAVCCILSLIYLGISFSGIYSPALSSALQLGALAVIPSGIYACVQAALTGMGYSHKMGILNMSESLGRALVAVVLLYFGFSVFTLIIVFVVSRWMIALIGLYLLSTHFVHKDWRVDAEIMYEIMRQAPRFATIMLAFLVIKNAGMVLLPALVHEAEVASYAVAYQLYDLALLIPSVLALTSNNLFSQQAAKSKPALRWVAMQLSAITSTILFPFLAMGILFSANIIHFLFGYRYEDSSLVLKILLIAVAISTVDQVLSQVMVSSKHYNDDKKSVITGALVVVVVIFALTPTFKAAGTAIALAISSLVTVIVRFYLLRSIFRARLLIASIKKPSVAAAFVFCVMWLVLHEFSLKIEISGYTWMILVPLGICFYGVVLTQLKGLNAGKLSRMKMFLFSR